MEVDFKLCSMNPRAPLMGGDSGHSPLSSAKDFLLLSVLSSLKDFT